MTARMLGIVMLTAAATAGVLAQAGVGQTPPVQGGPTLAQAQARMAAQDPAGAIKILDQLVAAAPETVAAWRMLGAVLVQTKQADRAIAALERANAIQPGPANVHYNLGVAFAMKGDTAKAIEALGRARAAGNIDMTRADVDPNFASLRTHPKFHALLPTDADFAAPFVEPVTILREWRGEAANDQFGWIARDIGDIDEDGVHDVVTSAPTRTIGGAAAGRVYVYSSLSGALRWTADGRPGDQLGLGIEAAGDVNKDGVPDVLASAPGRSEAYVYSGRDGKVLLTMKGDTAGEGFGRHVAGVGDVNGDGHPDLFIGAPGRPPGPPPAAGAAAANAPPAKGRALVYSGKDGALLLELSGEQPGDQFGSTVGGDPIARSRWLIVGAPGAGPNRTGRAYVYDGLNAKPKFTIESDDTGVALGAMFASVPGDVNGDGIDDVFVSDFPNRAKGPSTGRVYLHSGKDGARIHALTGSAPGEALGTSSSVVGDTDADGHADLLIGAWQHASAATSGGRIYLYSGKTGQVLRTITGRIPGETLGFDAVGIGDVNGDGAIDYLVTSAWSGVRGNRSGRVFILSGR